MARTGGLSAPGSDSLTGFAVTPTATPFEKQQRRKLWQAVLLQDTFMTVLLSLPPSATHTDVNVEDLADDASSIANEDPTDMAYIRGSWTLANLVQETICSPRSLDLPICSTQRQKSKLIADFRAVYRSFPDVFRSWDPESLTHLAASNKRIVRQTLFLTSNYYHNLMLVHASESADVPVNVRGTLEAAHEAITSFFLLFTLFDHESRVWWVFNHRAFLEALCIGSVLREALRETQPADLERAERDPLFTRAKADISESFFPPFLLAPLLFHEPHRSHTRSCRPHVAPAERLTADNLPPPARMVQIMKVMGDGGSNVARTRVAVLTDFL